MTALELNTASDNEILALLAQTTKDKVWPEHEITREAIEFVQTVKTL